jgi:O-antigen/teichoic acid export membrane protein
MNIFAIISVIEAVLKLFVAYLLTMASFDKLILYSWLLLGINLVITIIYIVYCIKQHQELKIKLGLDKEIFKKIIGFSGWNTFGSLGSVMTIQGMNIIMNMFFGPIATAAMAISYQVNGAVNSIATNLQSAVTPQITKLYASNQIEELNKLLYQNAKYAFLLMWVFALPLIFEIDYILNLWLKNPPQHVSSFIQLLLVVSLVYSLDKPFVNAIHATGKMKETNITAGVILMMVLPISYAILYNGLSIVTPLIVYIFAVIICFGIELYYLNKWIKTSLFDFFKQTILPLSYIIILSMGIVYFVIYNMESTFFRLIFVCGLSFLSIFVLAYFLGLSKDEKNKVNEYFTRKKL